MDKPKVYDPVTPRCKSPSVKAIEFRDEVEVQKERPLKRILAMGTIMGFVGGFLLLNFDASRAKLQYDILDGYQGGQITAHCIIWGVVIGALMGLILYPAYVKLNNALPVYALLLFLPIILFFLSPLLATVAAWLGQSLLFIVILVIIIIAVCRHFS